MARGYVPMDTSDLPPFLSSDGDDRSAAVNGVSEGAAEAESASVFGGNSSVFGGGNGSFSFADLAKKSPSGGFGSKSSKSFSRVVFTDDA